MGSTDLSFFSFFFVSSDGLHEKPGTMLQGPDSLARLPFSSLYWVEKRKQKLFVGVGIKNLSTPTVGIFRRATQHVARYVV